MFSNRQRIQQRLGGMFMRAVAGVNDRRLPHSRQVVWRTGHRMPNDDAIRRHGFKIARRVEEGLALADAGSGNADVDRVRRQTLGGDFEGGTGSCRRLKEEINYCSPAQRRHLLNFAAGNITKRFGGIQQVCDLTGFQFAYAQ